MSFFINCPFFQYNIKHLIFVCVNIHIAGGIRSCVHRYTSVEECARAHVEARGHLWVLFLGSRLLCFLTQGLSLGPGAHREDGDGQEAKTGVLPVSASPVKTTEKTPIDYTLTVLP